MEATQYFLFQKHTMDYFWGSYYFLGITEFAFLSVFGSGTRVRKSLVIGH